MRPDPPRSLCCVLLGVVTALLAGCLNPARFDPEMRAACFDSLWKTLETGHADVTAVERARAARPLHRERVIAADTRREYVVELARFLANFDDVHMGFDDLDDYWRVRTGHSPISLIGSGVWLGGHIWVEFNEASVAAQGDAVRARLFAEKLYELTAVDGVPADHLGALPLVFALLRGQPGESVTVSLRIDESEETVTLLFPDKPAGGSPASAPAASRPVRMKPVAAGSSVASQKLEGDIGYIWLGDLSSALTVQDFHTALDALLDTKALVLDVRDNHGGTRGPIESVLSRFVDGVNSYASAQARIPRLLPLGDPTWWLGFRGYVWGREPIYRRPVVVLIDATTLSSAEILASALRDLCGATLVGEKTIGAGAAVATLTLPDGLSVRYGAFLIRRPDGRPFQGQGIEPDISVAVDLDAVRRGGLREMRRWTQNVATVGYLQALHRGGSIANITATPPDAPGPRSAP